MSASPIRSAVKAGSEHPWLTLAVVLAISAAALWFVVGHFSMTSDTAELISSKVAWRQHEIAMDKAFPQNGDSTVVVGFGSWRRGAASWNVICPRRW